MASTYSDVNAGVIELSPSDLLYDENDVYQSIVTIFATRKRSRLFRRKWGNEFATLLFDPITERVAFQISAEIPAVLAKYEPRVTLLAHEVLPDYENESYWVRLECNIPELNRDVNWAFAMRR